MYPFIIKYLPEIAAVIFSGIVVFYIYHKGVQHEDLIVSARDNTITTKVEKSNNEIRNSVNDYNTTYNLMHSYQF